MGYVGVYLGLICGLAGWFYGRKQAKKNNGIDEMYDFVMSKSQSIAWYSTIAAIYVLMSLVIFGIELSAMMVLSLLLFIVLGSWAISFFILFAKLSEPVLPIKSQRFISVVISSIMIIFFVVMSLITDNWKFILFALPAIALNTFVFIKKK